MNKLFLCLFLPCIFFADFEKLDLKGPNVAYVMTINPNQFEMRIGLAQDSYLGLESVPSIAKRYRAHAAINGGFFLSDPYLGGSAGLLKVNNALLATSTKNRGVIAWDRGGDSIIERIQSIVNINGQSISGLNCPRKDTDIVLYSWPFNGHTLTNPGGTEYLIDSNHNIVEITKAGNAKIPIDGHVLSVGPDTKLDQSLDVGSLITIKIDFRPLLGTKWKSYENILSGTPVLIHNGKIIDDYGPEQILDRFATQPYSRSAFGIKKSGEIMFVVVDGHSEHSIGMTLKELASLMHDLGCTEALNLDGGGSSTFVYNGQVHNIPSAHKNRPSPVGNALLILSKK